ncbi:MAG: hypothetical protein R6U40_12950 [Desulfobacterales bacterium]
MAYLQNKKAMGSLSLPTALTNSKKLNVCRQVHYKTRHHQHSDIMFILMLNLSSFLFAAKNSVLQKYRRCQDKIL